MEKTVFTKEERIEMYKYVQNDLQYDECALCIVLNRLLIKRLRNNEYDKFGKGKHYSEYLYDYFPELLMVKPEKINNVDNLWWPIEDRQIRIEKLDEMIKLCENGKD
jgi:hypothetical protein